ncbi:MAG: hypothetical protein JJU28_15855 [Cyclobacteriaceae bacterium]|nr:hypothetical protein [Cyclobacteriaceae bacterium]
MKKHNNQIAGIFRLLHFICWIPMMMACISDPESPIQSDVLEDKYIVFEIFADRDFPLPQFEHYEVKLDMGVSLISKNNGQEEIIFLESTGWLPFSEIPHPGNAIVHSVNLQKVNTQQYLVNIGFTYQYRIQGTLQMYATHEFMKNGELYKNVPLRIQ